MIKQPLSSTPRVSLIALLALGLLAIVLGNASPDKANAQGNAPAVTLETPGSAVLVGSVVEFVIKVNSPTPLTEVKASFVFSRIDVVEILGVRPGQGWEGSEWSADSLRSDAIRLAQATGSLQLGGKMPSGSVPAGESAPFIISARVLPFIGEGDDVRVPLRVSSIQMFAADGQVTNQPDVRAFMQFVYTTEPTPTPGPTPTPDASKATGRIFPVTHATDLAPGDEFEIEIRHESAASVRGVQATISFNPAVLQIELVEWSDAWDGAITFQGVGQTMGQAIAEANRTGELKNIAAALLGRTLPGGNYLDFTLLMRAVGGGESPISLSSVELADGGSVNALPTTSSSISVSVAGPVATPTLTGVAAGTPLAPTETTLADVSIGFSPDRIRVSSGSESRVALSLDSNVPLRSVSATVAFNPGLVELVSAQVSDGWADAAVIFGDGGSDLAAAVGQANESGSFKFDLSFPEGGSIEPGNTAVFDFTFKARSARQASTLIVNQARARSSDGRLVPLTALVAGFETTDDIVTPGGSSDSGGVRYLNIAPGFPWVTVLGALGVAALSTGGAVVAFRRARVEQ